MRRCATALGAMVLGAMALSGAARAQPADLDAVFAGYGPTGPGCAVGVKRGDQPPVLRAYGLADLEHSVAITPETVFEAGSVAKQFTAAAVLLLADEGKLSLSDDIRKHLPEMPDYGRPITVDMLLSHTSGLRDWGEVMALAGWPRTSRVYTHAEVLQIAARQRALNHAPGAAYSYTNTGYNLAALIVQRLSGYSLADYTRLKIFQPLGMNRTSWRDNFRRVVAGRAVAYRAVGDGFGQDMPFENTHGHGGLLTTVGDLLIWNDALASGRLGPTLYGRLQASPTLTDGRKIAYARGLMNLTFEGRREMSHGGATAGYRAWLGRLPAQNLSVALLCNRADANPVMLGHLAAGFVSLPNSASRRLEPPPTADIERLPGLYVDERAGGVLLVSAKSYGLEASGVGALTPTGAPGRYEAAATIFRFDARGVRREGVDGEVATFRRITPARPTGEDLQAIAGAYASSEVGAVLNLSVRNGRLILAPADRPSTAEAVAPLHPDAFRVDGGIVRVLRAPDGRVTGLRFTTGRVHSLDFRRIEGS
ncbi:MAG: serine hydrolase domain-containing protein [Phenylobacterium sp.]|nr:serine hydrolase domain-containing protein [Phenylobacterium sp.]